MRHTNTDALAARMRTDATLVQLIGGQDTWHPVDPDGIRAPFSRFNATRQAQAAASIDPTGLKHELEGARPEARGV